MTPAEKLSSANHKKTEPYASGRTLHWRCELVRLRHELHLTLRDIEAATGITSAALSTIEHGTDPRLTTATTIARFFGKAIEEIWTERIDP